ncbi:MAG: hypothetical protein ACRD2N_05655 [Vicinamibacterales bacterium]
MQKAEGRGFTSAVGSIAALVVFALAASCSLRSGPSTPEIELNQKMRPATVDVVGLPSEVLSDLDRLRPEDDWRRILRVSVGPEQPAMLGAWAVVDRRLRFTPMFPLDPGRSYQVVFTPPGSAAGVGTLSATVALPDRDRTPTTVVATTYPTGDVVPENQLRLYVHFSAPMGLKGGLDYIHLLDDAGREVKDPFLPLDAEFWNDDRTRYTVFFDPGRVKKGVRPNEEMGRSMIPGRTYTIVIDAKWPDGSGLPLRQGYRRSFRVAPPDERPLDTRTWKLTAPASGTRDPLTVDFSEPLDHGLLLRALGVQAEDGQPLAGAVAVMNGETRWSWSPLEPWHRGSYRLVVFGMLEDLAGNRIGRAFEVDRFDRTDSSPEPEKMTVPFTVR